MIKVLVVDDDEAVRSKTMRALARPNIQLASASNGELALAQARELQPDMVICDIDMPGIDGFEVLESLRADPQLSTTLVMILTSHASRDSMRLGMTLGADDYLTKPFTEEELATAFDALMKKRGRIVEAIDVAVKGQEEYLRRAFGESLGGDTVSERVLTATRMADSGFAPTNFSPSGFAPSGFAPSGFGSGFAPLTPAPGQTLVNAAVLFSDIRGFTSMAEKLTAAEVATLLTEYFERVCEPVLANGGHYLKMIGDGLMAVFTDSPNIAVPAARRALGAAVGMAAVVKQFGNWVDAAYPQRGLPSFHCGYGVHFGEVAISAMGSARDKEPTPIGDTVNIAARLESASKELGWTIVASQSIIEQAGFGVEVRAMGSLTVRGKTLPIQVNEVVSVQDPTHFDTTVQMQTLRAGLKENADIAARAVKSALDEKLTQIRQHGFADGPLRMAGYTILRRIGSGGMSSIYLATRDSDGELVVLKILTAGKKATEQLARFVREYSLLSTIKHPNIVRIFHQGFSEDNAYIAMEYFENGDLRSRMGKPLPVQRAVEIALQVASALEAIHARGIVHRDLKPENLMVRADGSIALADFGIAKLVSGPLPEKSLTQHGELVGSPSYMSPEQVSAKPVTALSDLYSLGVVFYEMLTGRRPYEADSLMQLLNLQANAGPPALPSTVAVFQPMIDKLMAKRPENRYRSADEVVLELQQWRR